MSGFYYQHERDERQPSGPLNQVWPEYSSLGTHQDRVDAYLLDRHLSPQIAQANGWYPSTKAGDSFLRVVIPATPRPDKPGHVYWQARDVTGKAALRYRSPGGPRADALVVVKADQARPSKQVVIVEGPMDALAAAHLGYDAVACMGISPPASTVLRLRELIQQRPALLVFDNEPEATKSAMMIMMTLSSLGVHLRVASLTGVNDLAKCTVAERMRFLTREFAT